MRRHRWWGIGMALLLALGGCGSRLERFRQRLNSESTEERLKAVEALEKWETPQAVELLKEALLDPDEAVRGRAVEALARRSEPEARQALLEVLEGQHWRKGAIHTYEKATELGADEANIRVALGRLYKDLGDRKRALEEAQAAEALAGENAFLLMNVQFLYQDLGETKKAKELEARVKELQPGIIPGGTFVVPPQE